MKPGLPIKQQRHPVKALLVLFFILSFGPLWAQVVQIDSSALGSSNPIDRVPPSARVAGMGAAFVGVADDASALFYNPAGLASLTQGEISVHSELGWLGSFQETALLGLPTAYAGGVGFSISYLTFGSLEGRDAVGSLSYNYSADRVAIQGGWGIDLIPEASLGLALRDSQQSITGTTYSSLAPEMGLLLRPVQDLKVGLDYVFGGWGPAGDPTVSTLRSGLSWTFRMDSPTKLLVAIGDSYETNSLDYLQAGAEFSYLSQFFLRAGYQAVLNGTGYGGFSCGAGVKVAGLILDYAYLPDADLGDTHRFSLSYPFETLNKSSANGSTNSPEAQKSTSPSNGSQENSSITGAPPKPDIQAPASDKDKDSLTLRFNIPPDFTAQGEARESQGNHAEAMHLFQQAVQQDPQNALAWWDMANIYYKLGQKAYALQCYEKVLSLKPGDKALVDWVAKYKQQNP